MFTLDTKDIDEYYKYFNVINNYSVSLAQIFI